MKAVHLVVLTSKSSAEVLNVFHATFTRAHLLIGEVGVATSTVPVGKQLRLERVDQLVIFSNTAKDVASHPQVVTDLDSFAGANLELPLARHNLGVGSSYLDSGVQAEAIVRIHDLTAVAVVCANGTVVWSLRSGEARRREAKRVHREVVLLDEERVLLLNSKPELLVLGSVKDLLSMGAEVRV